MTVLGLMGAVGVLAAVSGAQAAPRPMDGAAPIESYSGLAKPIPTAVTLGGTFAEPQAPASVMTVQYYRHPYYRHYHPYYHGRYYRHYHRGVGIYIR